jgi:hypothetical protein
MNHKPIVSGALAYDNPITGEVLLLVIHQAIYIEEITNHLLCPMQLRMNDITLNEEPKFCSANPTDETHAITIPGEDVRIPLSLSGVTSYFTTRKPTDSEWTTCRRIELTYEMPEWNPHSKSYSDMENYMTDHFGHAREGTQDRYYDQNRCVLESACSIASTTASKPSSMQEFGKRTWQSSCILSDISKMLNDNKFCESLRSHVTVSYTATTSHVSSK